MKLARFLRLDPWEDPTWRGPAQVREASVAVEALRMGMAHISNRDGLLLPASAFIGFALGGAVGFFKSFTPSALDALAVHVAGVGAALELTWSTRGVRVRWKRKDQRRMRTTPWHPRLESAVRHALSVVEKTRR